MTDLTCLHDELQRRLVLRAARECAPERFPQLRKNPLTVAELDKEIRENVWWAILMVWTIFGTIAAVSELVPLYRMRRAVDRHWQEWRSEPNAEIDQCLVEGGIRRILKDLPRSHRREAREIGRELDRISQHWADFQRKLDGVRGALAAMSEEDLDSRRRTLAAQVETETDPLTRDSLNRQFQSIEGQQEAHRDLFAWQSRLEAAQGECTQSLLHLRSRLALLVASSGTPELAAMNEAASELQAVNAHLSSAQAAAEEVLRLRA